MAVQMFAAAIRHEPIHRNLCLMLSCDCAHTERGAAGGGVGEGAM